MSQAIRLLLVEDDDPLRQILEEVLGERGLQVLCADQQATALDLARRFRPHLGLLDMHLGNDTGLDLIRAIRAEVGPLPAIMMSGEASFQETQAALDEGVFTFLRKPLQFEQLWAQLDRLLATHFPRLPRPGIPD